MQWLILCLFIPAVLVPVVLLWGFAGCAAFGSTPTYAAPTGLDAEGTGVDTIDLKWQATPGGTPVYKVFRAVPGGVNAQINTGVEKSAITYTDGPSSNLKEGVTYLYQVKASPTGTDSSLESDFSNTSSATTSPAAPSGLTATAPSETQIDLTWTNNSVVATDFVLEHRTPPGAGNFTSIANISTVNFSHTGLVPGSTHEYQVKATVNGVANSQPKTIPSAPSPPAQATTAATTTTGFTTAFSTTLTTDQLNLPGICIVQVFGHAVLTASGNKVKITVRAAAGGDLTLDRIYISHVDTAGDPFDSLPAGTQGGLTKVLDSSLGDGPLMLPAGTSQTLGPFSFALDQTKDLLIAFDINNTPPQSNIIRNPTFNGATAWGKKAVEAAIANRSGFGAGPNSVDLVEKIEVAP